MICYFSARGKPFISLLQYAIIIQSIIIIERIQSHFVRDEMNEYNALFIY